MAIAGIVLSGFGLMMMTIVIVKECTRWLDNIACLDARIVRRGGVLTTLGGKSLYQQTSYIEYVVFSSNLQRNREEK